MIDIEADVFNRVYESVAPLVPQGCFKSVYVPNPPKFPFATLMEMDNFTDKANRSSALDEEYAVVTYEANVYATDKLDCRNVMNALDTEMLRLGFHRLSMQYVPNLADSTIFRYTSRYQATTDRNKVIYRKN